VATKPRFVSSFRNRDVVVVPARPVAGFVSSDQQDCLPFRIEANRMRIDVAFGLNSFMLWTRDPSMRSTVGLPSVGPSCSSKSIAASTASADAGSSLANAMYQSSTSSTRITVQPKNNLQLLEVKHYISVGFGVRWASMTRFA